MADGSQSESVNLGFLSAALPDSTALQLVGVDGREQLSSLFSFELLLQRHGEPLTDDELEQLVQAPCVVALGLGETDLVHGILTSIEHLDSTRHVAPMYVANMVPQIAMLDFGSRSAIYQEMDVAQLVETVLRTYGLSPGQGYQMLVADGAKSPKHEYIVQYRESDWAFVQRWLEHEGFFYWLEHGKKGAKLVIADSNDDTSAIAEPQIVSFRERNNLATGGVHSIWDLHVQQQRVPRRVTVVDYNHRRPTELLLASHDVDSGGYGHVVDYGDHLKDKGVADGIAKIRAQELGVSRRVVRGTTDCPRFRVGHVFELENHHHAAYDGKYLITSIHHRAGLDVPSFRLAQGDVGPETPRAFRADFTAIPLDIPFRPRRVTPRPRIHGLINGHVEADTAGDYAQIDEHGRYKVKLPFDVGATRGLASSRWIRLAQAYAGSGYGQHFPLHKGTEVLVAHIDGDPDRPVIVGSVPNVATPGPVVDANATQSVTQTASGMRIELEDLQQ